MKTLSQETAYELGTVVHTFNPSTPGGKSRRISELMVSVVYKMSYGTVGAT